MWHPDTRHGLGSMQGMRAQTQLGNMWRMAWTRCRRGHNLAQACVRMHWCRQGHEKPEVYAAYEPLEDAK